MHYEDVGLVIRSSFFTAISLALPAPRMPDRERGVADRFRIRIHCSWNASSTARTFCATAASILWSRGFHE
jgi:hypothetical protein